MTRKWSSIALGTALLLCVTVGCGPQSTDSKTPSLNATQTGANAERETNTPTTVTSKPIGVVPGDRAPNFSLDALSTHQTISLESLLARRQPIFINAFASWCGPCKSETPDIVSAFKLYSAKIQFVAVNITSTDSVEGVKQYVNDFRVPYPVLMDTDGSFLNDYAISAFPTSLLIDPDGTIIARKVGMFKDADELAAFLRQVLPKS
jgi:cytochrome c biogenesis protein CcmG, thiol:disulfide interchange protein DsbE